MTKKIVLYMKNYFNKQILITLILFILITLFLSAIYIFNPNIFKQNYDIINADLSQEFNQEKEKFKNSEHNLEDDFYSEVDYFFSKDGNGLFIYLNDKKQKIYIDKWQNPEGWKNSGLLRYENNIIYKEVYYSEQNRAYDTNNNIYTFNLKTKKEEKIKLGCASIPMVTTISARSKKLLIFTPKCLSVYSLQEDKIVLDQNIIYSSSKDQWGKDSDGIPLNPRFLAVEDISLQKDIDIEDNKIEFCQPLDIKNNQIVNYCIKVDLKTKNALFLTELVK